jgi:integrase
VISRAEKSRILSESSRPKWEALRRSDFGSSEKTYLVVYIRFVVNRVAFYVPLLEGPKTERFSRTEGKTPAFVEGEVPKLLGAVEASTHTGLRDRALLRVLAYTFARIGAVVNLKVEDYYPSGKQFLLRFNREGRQRKRASRPPQARRAPRPVPKNNWLRKGARVSPFSGCHRKDRQAIAPVSGADRRRRHAQATPKASRLAGSLLADLSGHTIAISGTNFGSTQPTVNLDAMQLAVTSFSPTAIQATLPAGLGPGSYHLVVSNFSTSPPRIGLLDVTIGNAGPAGPQDPQGPRVTRVTRAPKGRRG